MATEITVPIDTLVPISKFGRGSANKEFAKVKDGVPVTVLRNSEPAYVILNTHDYRALCESQIKLQNLEARRQDIEGEGEVFDSIEELMADLHD